MIYDAMSFLFDAITWMFLGVSFVILLGVTLVFFCVVFGHSYLHFKEKKKIQRLREALKRNKNNLIKKCRSKRNDD